MPLTFAHPAAAIPLQKLFGRFGFLPALAIGSMVPDLPYFVPIAINHHLGHNVPALFWFCVPVGLAMYWLFEYFLKQPFISLCLFTFQSRLVASPVTKASMAAILWSILIGASTHLLWDSFTHPNSPWLQYLPFLENQLFSLGNYKVYVFKIFQHGGTFVGLGLITHWFIRWYKNTPQQIVSGVLPLRTRIRTWGIILFPGLLLGTFLGISSIGTSVGINALQNFLGKAIFSSVTTSIIIFFLYSSWWHYNWRRQRNQDIS
jgi:hypothetical protein